MSKVYSFRLSEDNPREVQATRVIEAWLMEGYSLRHVIVEALNEYRQENQDRTEYLFLLEQLKKMADGFEKNVRITHEKNSLSETFLAGMKRSAQTGIQA